MDDRSTPAEHLFLSGGGHLGALMRAHDWQNTTIGPPTAWPAALKTLVGVMLASVQPMFVAWGPERLLLYNDGYAPMLDARHPAALGRPFFAVWTEASDALTPLFDQVFAGEPVHMDDIELRLDRPGRPAEAHFAFSYTPVRDEDGPVVGLFCPCTETTDQVLAERGKADAAERQRRLFQQMPGFVAVLTGPEHVYAYVNDAYVETAGPRHFVGRTVREVLPELVGQGFYELLDRVYSTGEPFAARAMPIRLEREHGDRFIDLLYQPVRDDAGTVTGIFVGGYDVTERMRAAAELRESEARVRLLADAVPHMVWITAADGRNEFFNRQWRDYTGHDWGTTAAEVAEDAIHPDDREATVTNFSASLASGCSFEMEHRIRSKAGEYRWFLARAEAYRDPVSGEITRWYGASVDIEDRKRVEDALRASEARLLELNAISSGR